MKHIDHKHLVALAGNDWRQLVISLLSWGSGAARDSRAKMINEERAVIHKCYPKKMATLDGYALAFEQRCINDLLAQQSATLGASIEAPCQMPIVGCSSCRWALRGCKYCIGVTTSRRVEPYSTTAKALLPWKLNKSQSEKLEQVCGSKALSA